MNTRVTLTVQSIRDTDKWFRVATVGPEQAMDALEGRGMHAGAVDCSHERIAIIINDGDPMSVRRFTDWFHGRPKPGWFEGPSQEEEDESMSTNTSGLSCTKCGETEHFGEFVFPEAVVAICRSCGAVAGARWAGSNLTRQERPATRIEDPHPSRTFEGTWTNLGESRDRPTWGARVVVQDGEDVPEGATIVVRSQSGKRARKTAGVTVGRLRDRESGEFIRLVEVS